MYKHPAPRVNIVSVDQVRRMVHVLFRHTIDKGMLRQSDYESAVIRVARAKKRSYGGRNRYREGGVFVDRPYISINYSEDVHTFVGDDPEDRLEKHIAVKDAKPFKGKAGRANHRCVSYFYSGYFVFMEYKSICHREGIGNLASRDVRAVLAAVVAHEMAHTVCYNTRVPQYSGRNHDDTWKEVYRELRADVFRNDWYQDVMGLLPGVGMVTAERAASK